MERILGENGKVLLDVKDSNSLMYLPLDQLVKQGAKGSSQQAMSLPVPASRESESNPQREVVRERRSR
jgi:membrane protease subunit HflK